MTDEIVGSRPSLFRQNLIKGISYGILILAALAMFIPFLWTISTSFKEASGVIGCNKIIPPHPTLAAYRTVLFDVPFLRWFLNSLIVASFVTVFNLLFDSMAGYALARIKFPGRNIIFLLLLGTMMIPGQVTMVPIFKILQSFGMLDTYYGLIVPFVVSIFGIFLMKQFFESVPKELEEAAMIDGCSRFGIYWRIILPLAGPALAALAIFTFLGSWNSFMMPLIIVSVPEMQTLPLGVAMFRQQYATNWTVLMAASVLITLPIAVLYVFFQRWFVEGISFSGLKG